MAETRSLSRLTVADRYRNTAAAALSTPAAKARAITALVGTLRGCGVEQLIAELFDGHNRARQHRHLFAQPADVNVDGACAAGVGVTPHVREQQIARQHAPAMLHQI